MLQIGIMDRRRALSRLDTCSLTDFQRKVLEATLDIPKGKTATYKQIAERIGRPGACRAVGTALKNNPVPITIPCHRVIRSNGELGLYSGKDTGRKRMLLKKEHAI